MTLTNLVKSILAGMSISIGGVAFLSVDSNVVGGILFGIGLITIYMFDWNLYTGKCCYLFDAPKKSIPIAFLALIGNLIGTVATGFLIRASGLEMVQKTQGIIVSKLGNSDLETFVLALFCGILMSVAVLGYKKQNDDFGRAIIVILPITVFIVAKFEHVVANMFYVALAGMWSMESVLFLLTCAAGNAIGCCIIPISQKLRPAK